MRRRGRWVRAGAVLVAAGVVCGCGGRAPAAGGVVIEPGELLFRNARAGAGNGMVASSAVGAPDGPRRVGSLNCVRVYAAAGTGVCLTMRRGGTPVTDLVVFDRSLREKQRVPITGLPSRARVSPSGRMVSWTVFVTGDAYTGRGMSTRTGVLDTRTGATLSSLESFKLIRDGAPDRSADLNYWGVTFAADDDRFYATAKTRGVAYLVVGRMSGRSMRALRANAECPSLSPDGTRLAFKKATGVRSRPWRLHVLDLGTMRETALAERASVDDQAAWLDDRTVMYGRADGTSTDVWAVPADGSGAPRKLIADAFSPAVVR
ncbi:hypothetical protein [Actinomadura parmotrematis]|uniref:TolB-like translocation protein n=1 Tax=Actinomadura parmotrematis TaxID=2864039 RepID=A0ABS7G0P9_9ACTN|nr:hypothetical protein [Actinomadura parmotrematis]MBW8486291.1 hypothetical protein [Actinomadura parmotrematis]